MRGAGSGSLPFAVEPELTDKSWTVPANKPFDPRIDVQAARSKALDEARTTLHQQVVELVQRALRSRASEQAAAAEAEGRHRDAEDEHVRVAALGAELPPPTRSWFETRYGIDPELVQAILDGDAAPLASPAAPDVLPLSAEPVSVLAPDGFYRGFPAVWLQLRGLGMSASELPLQSPHGAGAVALDLGFAPLAAALAFAIHEGGWGFTGQDELVVGISLGGRSSDPHRYPDGSEEEQVFAYGIHLHYAAMVGYRGGYVGGFAGLRAQYVTHAIGDFTQEGGMIPFAARFELRPVDGPPFIASAWGFNFVGPAQAHGGELSLPLIEYPTSPGEDVAHEAGMVIRVTGRLERLELDTRYGGLNVDDRIDAGYRPIWLGSGGLVVDY